MKSKSAKDKTEARKFIRASVFALVECEYRPAQKLCGAHIMGDKKGIPPGSQPHRDCGGPFHQFGIHAGKGFVQQKGPGRTAEQRPEQRSAALLPARKPPGWQCQLDRKSVV